MIHVVHCRFSVIRKSRDGDVLITDHQIIITSKTPPLGASVPLW